MATQTSVKAGTRNKTAAKPPATDPFKVTGPEPVITVATNSEFPGITGRLVKIYADEAAEYLTLNHTPRPRKQRNQDKIKRAIRVGQYIVDGIAICFEAGTGLLQNGQHRFFALVDAQREEDLEAAAQGREPVRLWIGTFVVEGLPSAARSTQDTNAGLSAKDWLTMSGHSYAGLLASSCKLIFQYETRDNDRGEPGGSTLAAGNTEVDEVIARHPEILVICKKVAAWAGKHKNMKGLPPSVAAFVMWLATYQDLYAGWMFMQRIYDGAVPDPASPVLAFRDKVQTAFTNRRITKLTALDITKWLILAWNEHAQGLPAREVTKAKNGTKARDIPDMYNGPKRGLHADPSHWEDMLDAVLLAKRLGLLPGHSEDL